MRRGRPGPSADTFPWCQCTRMGRAGKTVRVEVILRGLVRRPGTAIYRARSPSPLGRTIALFRAATFGLVNTGVLRPAFAATPVFLGRAGAGRARFATFLRSGDCTTLPDGGSNRPNPYLWPKQRPGKIVGFTTGPIAPAHTGASIETFKFSRIQIIDLTDGFPVQSWR